MSAVGNSMPLGHIEGQTSSTTSQVPPKQLISISQAGRESIIGNSESKSKNIAAKIGVGIFKTIAIPFTAMGTIGALCAGGFIAKTVTSVAVASLVSSAAIAIAAKSLGAAVAIVAIGAAATTIAAGILCMSGRYANTTDTKGNKLTGPQQFSRCFKDVMNFSYKLNSFERAMKSDDVHRFQAHVDVNALSDKSLQLEGEPKVVFENLHEAAFYYGSDKIGDWLAQNKVQGEVTPERKLELKELAKQRGDHNNNATLKFLDSIKIPTTNSEGQDKSANEILSDFVVELLKFHLKDNNITAKDLKSDNNHPIRQWTLSNGSSLIDDNLAYIVGKNPQLKIQLSKLINHKSPLTDVLPKFKKALAANE